MTDDHDAATICNLTGVHFFTAQALVNYRDFGLPPGDFLWGVLTNDLVYAVSYADPDNRDRIAHLTLYLARNFPDAIWGNETLVTAHMADRRRARQEAHAD